MADRSMEVFYTAGQDVYCWAEQETSVMLKAITLQGDPVELEPKEARDLAAVLLRPADEIDK